MLFLISKETECEMAASRFTSLSEENIIQLPYDKDSGNTKSTKLHRLIFESYLKEKSINPTTAEKLTAVLRKVLSRGEKKVDRCTKKTLFVASDLLCAATSNKNLM